MKFREWHPYLAQEDRALDVTFGAIAVAVQFLLLAAMSAIVGLALWLVLMWVVFAGLMAVTARAFHRRAERWHRLGMATLDRTGR